MVKGQPHSPEDDLENQGVTLVPSAHFSGGFCLQKSSLSLLKPSPRSPPFYLLDKGAMELTGSIEERDCREQQGTQTLAES